MSIKNPYSYESISDLRTELDQSIVDCAYDTHTDLNPLRDQARFYIVRLTDCLKIVGNKEIMIAKKFQFLMNVIEGSHTMVNYLKEFIKKRNGVQ